MITYHSVTESNRTMKTSSQTREDTFKRCLALALVLLAALAAHLWHAPSRAAPPDATPNARALIQARIDATQAQDGGAVRVPAGTHLLDGPLVITGDMVRLVGDSRASILKAAPGVETLIHFAGSHGGVENLTLDGGQGNELNAMLRGEAGVQHESARTTAILLAPRPPLPDGRRVHQNYNRFSNLLIAGCRDGIVMQAGPNTPRGDSGCWYNVIDTALIVYTTRGVWLRDPVGGAGSSVNRNQFYSVRIGQFVNTGIQIDAGDTNSFVGCSFEGINSGTAPSATPTAILIKASSAAGADNNNNTFMAARFEGNTVDVDNRNSYSEFYASGINYAKKFRGSRPLYLVGGYDPSYTPLVMPGMIHSEGSMQDVPSGITFQRPVRFKGGVAGE